MKKVLSFLLILTALLTASACESSQANNSSKEIESEAITSEEIIEISKEVGFVDKFFNEEDGYYYENTYATDGTLLLQKISDDTGKPYELSEFYSDGRQKLYKEYGKNGVEEVVASFKYLENVIRVTYTDAEGKVFLITDAEYKDGKIYCEKSYDFPDILIDETFYYYNSIGMLERSDSKVYEDGKVYSHTESQYNTQTGNITESNEHYFDENGELVYTDRYAIKDGKYGFINRFGPNGEVIPVTD